MKISFGFSVKRKTKNFYYGDPDNYTDPVVKNILKSYHYARFPPCIPLLGGKMSQ